MVIWKKQWNTFVKKVLHQLKRKWAELLLKV